MVAERRSTALFKELDKDGDGKLIYAEAGNVFRDAFDRIDVSDKAADPIALAKERTATALKELDQDEDGFLSRKEAQGSALDRHFGRMDLPDPATNKGDNQLTADEIVTFFAKHEIGRDGVITIEELRRYYVANKITGDGVMTPAELRGMVGGYRNGMGDGPRGTPTVDGDRIYVEGGNGDLACLEAATGKTIWYVNLRTDFGGGTPGWGYFRISVDRG